MGIPLRVLILEDRPSDAELIVYEVRRGGFEPDWKCVDNEADFRARLQEAPDIVLADYSLPQWDAPHALRVLQELALDIPFIMISGTVGEDVAVECMKLGATDYLLKDRLGRLAGAITRALSDRRAQLERQQAEKELRRLQEMNEAIIQTASEGISLRDANGCYTFVNPAAAAILGSHLDELLGEHWTTVVAPESHQTMHDVFERQKAGESVRYEVNMVRKDGTRRTVWASSVPRFEAGRFSGTLAIFSDITESKRAEEALAHERNLLRTLIDSLPDVVYVKDAEGRFMLGNKALARQAGVPSPDHLIGRSDADTFSSEKAAEFRADELRVMTTGEPLINKEEQAVFPDGQLGYVLTTKVPLHDSYGHIVGLVGNSHDITQRKQSEATLAHERNLLRTLIDSLPDVVYAKDTEGRFILTNQAGADQVRESSPERVLGKNDFDYFSAEKAEKFWADDLKVITTGEPLLNKEEVITYPNGQVKWLLTTKVPLRDSQGNIIGLVGNGHDITQRKRSEEVLAQERNLLRTLIDNLPDYVYAKDTEGRFILLNEANARLLGVATPQDAVGKHDVEFFPPAIAAKFSADDRHVISTGQALVNMEELVVVTEGRQAWALTTKVPLRDSRGEVIGLVGIGRDITERKRADETLRRSEAKFRSFVEQSAQGIMLSDEEGRIIEWNRSMEQISGLSKDQVAGSSVWSVQRQLIRDNNQAEASIELVRDTVTGLLRTGQAPWALQPLDQELTRPDGEVRYVQLVYFPIETEKGYTSAAVVQDITDRRKAEQAVRESEEIMRYVVKHDPSDIAIFDTQMRYIAVSDRYLQDYWITEADIIGKSHYDVFPELPQQVRDVHQRCLQGAVERSDGDERFERFDGSVTYTRWECRPWYWIDGRIGGIVLYSEVTTERKLAELEILRLNADLERRIDERTTELSHIKERVEAILNSSSDAIILCRTNGLIDQANPALSKVCQLDPGEIFLYPLAALVIPTNRPDVNRVFQETLDSGSPQRLEVTVIRKDGSTFEADMMLSPVLERDEHLLGVVCSLRDISAHKLMEAQLHQMLKQAIDMSELRARYVSMAAHDLGNPLAAIQALVTTVQMYGDRMSEAQKQAKFEEILGGTKAMADILSDVLTMGRVEGGQLRFTPAPLNLHDFCLSMTAEVLQATGSSRNIQFSNTGDCESAFADARLLRHIIGNLLTNALKYSPADSDVIFSMACTAQEVTFRVQDRGIGIPEADKARVFTAFHRASNARQIPGTGLGLAIVKQSVELHGGTITFESAQGQGTTFVVRLPTSAALHKEQGR